MTDSKLDVIPACIVTGATSPVGVKLVDRLIAASYLVHAISRNTVARDERSSVEWHQFDLTRPLPFPFISASILFHVASLWLLPDRIGQFHENGVRRILAFSSTSRFSKMDSSSSAERSVAKSLAHAEDSVMDICERLGIVCTIFRPTLIYGAGADRNITDIARFAKRFGAFPILGKGSGLRQPVHVEDLAQACVLAANSPASFKHIYNLSGGETLPYREMVQRVFSAMGKKGRIVTVPEPLFRLAIRLVQCFPKYKHLKPEMAMRMDQDLCFDHLAAMRDFGFSPRPFSPDFETLGSK